VEIRLIDASTETCSKPSSGEAPFGPKRQRIQPGQGWLSIDFGLDDILEGFLRQLDLWIGAPRSQRSKEKTSTSMPANYPVFALEIPWRSMNPARRSSIQHEPLPRMDHRQTERGVRVTDLFGVDAAIGKVVQGSGFSSNDVANRLSGKRVLV